MVLHATLALLLASPGRCVEIAAISDLHGRVNEMPLLAARVAELRARGPTLVLDAGDGLQGTVEVRLSQGQAVVAGYGALGLAAAAVGNHDFDYGSEALRRRVAAAPYPFLAANIRDAATGRRLAWQNLHPRRLFRLPGGPAVGVFGLSGEDTPWVTMPRNVAGLAFPSAAREAERQARALRAEGADIVVGLAHIGGSCRDLGDPDDLSSCDPGRELFRLARRLPAGLVDALVGGHTHGFVNHRVSGVALLQAGARAEALGWLTLCAGAPARFHPFLRIRHGEPPEPDARVAAAVAPFVEAARAERERPVGVRLVKPLTRDRRRLSPFGAAAAAGVRAALGTDFAVVNSGSLRLDLPAGDLTFGQLYEAFPFDDDLAVLRVRRADLMELFRLLARDGKGYPQAAGLRFDGAEVRTCAGEPLDPERVYTLGTNEFLLNGGDGTRPVMSRLRPGRVSPRGDVDFRGAFLAWLRAAPPERLAEPCP